MATMSINSIIFTEHNYFNYNFSNCVFFKCLKTSGQNLDIKNTKYE